MKRLRGVLSLYLIFSSFGVDAADKEKYLVVTSIRPLGFLLSQICREYCDVKAMIPYSISEHDWSPTPKDLISVSKAKIAFGVGLGFDDRIIQKIILASSKTKAIYLGKELNPMKLDERKHVSKDDHDHHHHDSDFDPHIWFDPFRMAEFVSKASQILIQELPEHKVAIAQNAVKTKEELYIYGKEMQAQRKNWTSRPILVFHDSLNYLADAFKLDIEPIVIGGSGKELSSKNFAKLIKNNKNKKYAGIIVETDDGLSKNLSRELKVPVVKLDFSGKPEVNGYIEWLDSILQAWSKFER
jgi:zinc transport system substrate-binding protein